MLIWRSVDKSLLMPSFVTDIEEFFAKSKYDWYVMQGFRSIEESNKLYYEYVHNNGPKAAPGGKSAHNFGLAIDVVLDADPDKPGLQPSWNTKLAGWSWLKATSIPHPRLKNGWSFADWPHVERYKWQNFKNWQQGIGG